MDKLVISGAEFAPVLLEILSSDGAVPIVVSGSSMFPFLKHGRDIVYLRACTEKDLKRGQILLFKRKDQAMILHRIRRVLPDGHLVMNGDGQVWCERISPDQVIAVVSSVERKGKCMSCDSPWFGLWNLCWYPTRPIRAALFKMGRLVLHKGRNIST